MCSALSHMSQRADGSPWLRLRPGVTSDELGMTPGQCKHHTPGHTSVHSTSRGREWKYKLFARFSPLCPRPDPADVITRASPNIPGQGSSETRGNIIIAIVRRGEELGYKIIKFLLFCFFTNSAWCARLCPGLCYKTFFKLYFVCEFYLPRQFAVIKVMLAEAWQGQRGN